MLWPPDKSALNAIDSALPHAANADEHTELLLGRVAIEDALGHREAAAKSLKAIAEGKGPRRRRASALRELASRPEEPLEANDAPGASHCTIQTCLGPTRWLGDRPRRAQRPSDSGAPRS